jgi:hypothetical protein
MKARLINAALLTTSIIFCFSVLEVGLRTYHGEWRYVNFRFPQGDHVKESYPAKFDVELGWVPKQDVQAIPNTWGTTVTILNEGIRSNGSGELRDGADPILAIGDSFTFGEQVSDWETWPAQLEQLLGRKVINGGVSGYGIDQAFLRARRFLSQYQFSTVIFSFIPDDIRRCQMSVEFGGAKPYFDIKDGRLSLENVPVPPPAGSAPRESGLLILLEHSRVVHSVMKKLFPEWWMAPQRSYRRQVHDEEKGRKVACAVLRELEKLTKSHGSELIVLVQHMRQETFSETTAGESVLRCLSDPATRVLDLKPARSELNAKDPLGYDRLYNSYGGHMTAEGNEFVAREIATMLTKRSMHVVRLPGR